MEKVLLILFIGLGLSCSVISSNCTDISYDSEARDPDPETNEFWPPDFIPHPLPPWDRPKRPSEGDLA